MKADQRLASLFCCFFSFIKDMHYHTHCCGVTSYWGIIVFEWQIAAKTLHPQHFFRDRQDFDRGSHEMMIVK